MRYVTAFLLCCLLCPLCLSAQPVSPPPSQGRGTGGEVAALPARVVQLLPGDVVQEPLIGLDSATYQAARAAVALVPAADAALADRERENTLLRQQVEASATELHATRAALASGEKDYQELLAASRKVASKPLARPLLLDPHFYTGAAAGAVATLLFLILHQ